ncbi:hypothetical protein MJO52_06530 [Microbulbifer variabilis]|uniref:Uncharacterized protein n=1 Tax=Microbulbifer variabilis TaxID=266805 RepID=A0ABY4VEP6_9GAMM|nr:hypothetical protein [Microbulbifer variabilis]USD22789.1 hypothetical protein MJO52_06530 [Microbulbifer variabilis]
MPPSHHRELANFLKENSDGNPSVTAYRDKNGNRPIPIGQFGRNFFSTIGACDIGLPLPAGSFEFSASGSNEWLPNSLASSLYWLAERACDEWPLVCEDVVKENVKSIYRHMAYVPSPFALKLSTGQMVKWLLGVPITDNEISISERAVLEKAQKTYPEWLFRARA